MSSREVTFVIEVYFMADNQVLDKTSKDISLYNPFSFI